MSAIEVANDPGNWHALQDEMTEDNSEVEQATRPRQRQSVAAAAVEEEAGTPTTRERRYATRQATAAAQRKPHSYNPALDFEKVPSAAPISTLLLIKGRLSGLFLTFAWTHILGMRCHCFPSWWSDPCMSKSIKFAATCRTPTLHWMLILPWHKRRCGLCRHAD